MHEIHTFTSLTVRVTDIFAIAHSTSGLIATEPTCARQAILRSTVAKKQRTNPTSRIPRAPYPVWRLPKASHSA